MKKLIISLLLGFFALASIAQTVPSQILTWKNGAEGAFTLTHDDFGLTNANGIENYVDTMCYNRGITMAFGAIVGQCDNSDWLKAKELVGHGNEIMNHSIEHKCGNPAAGDWCTAYGVWDESDFSYEFDFASAKIEFNVGPYPRFFIYPFDQYIPEMNQYLEDSLNYLGTRSGIYDFGPNAHNVSTPFEPSFWVTRPVYYLDTILLEIDSCVNTGGWGMREFHGVQDVSWGTVSYNDYRTILNHLRAYQETGELWVANPSEAISYIMQREAFVSEANVVSEGIEVSWNDPNYDMTQRLGAKFFTSPITLELDLSAESGSYVVSQGFELITDTRMMGDLMETNVYPDQGNVLLTDTTQCSICLIKNPVDLTAAEGESVIFNVLAVGEELSYKWFIEPGVEITNSDTSALLLENLSSSDIGAYYVEISNTAGEIITSLSANLSVSSEVGVNELDALNYFSVYPNPVSERLTIASVYNDAFSYEILSLSGELVLNGEDVQSNVVMDMSNLNSGMYIVKMKTENQVYLTHILVD